MNAEELNMNLKSLKKVDPYIVSIEAHSGQVALYKFNGGKQDWEKTQVEGTLFVYRREASPQYGFTIMNRLNIDNLVEPVTKDLDFQLQTPFLLYRNHANDIFGIWFYVEAECEKVGKKIEDLVKVVTEEQKVKQETNNAKGGNLQQLFKNAEASKNKTSSGNSDVSGKNLLRLLSGQDAGSSGPQPIMEGITPTSEKPTNSVKDFFAKAVSSTESSSAFTSVPAMFSAPPLPNGVPGVPITAMPISQGLAMGAVPVGGYQMLPPPGVAGPANPLQRLMSNPGIHSVESIEAEQRKSVSPNQDQVNTLPPGLAITPNTKKMNALESDLKQKLHIGSSGASVTINNNSINHRFAPVKVKELQEEESDSRGVKLLSPEAFSSGRPTQSPSPSLVKNGVSPPTTNQVTPLTQPQLVEAITFLMENDPEFVQKIHQGYVMSLNRKLTTIK
jgi:mRNA-decapping enzyme 1B